VFVSVNVKLLSSDFNLNWKESINFVKNFKYKILRNSVWGEGIASGQTCMTGLIITFEAALRRRHA